MNVLAKPDYEYYHPLALSTQKDQQNDLILTHPTQFLKFISTMPHLFL
jgi:hypothetical protein